MPVAKYLHPEGSPFGKKPKGSSRAKNTSRKKLKGGLVAPKKPRGSAIVVTATPIATRSTRGLRLPLRRKPPKTVSADMAAFLDSIVLKGSNLENEASKLLKGGKIAIVKTDGLKRGEMLKLFPDGRRQIVGLDDQYQEIVVKEL